MLDVPSGQATTPTSERAITRNGLNLVGNFGMNVPGGSPLLAAELPADGVASATLTTEQVQPLIDEALARWEAAGADTSVLQSAEVHITDLGGLFLGLESGTTIRIDDDAAGWGWYIDATPADDSEFTTPGDQGEQGRMDLLTVVMHEFGHILGGEDLYDPADSGQLMYGYLDPGERRTPTGAVTEEEAALELFGVSVDSGQPALPAAAVPSTPDLGSPDGPDAGTSVDIALLLAPTLEDASLTPESPATGGQDEPVWFAFQLPSPPTTEEEAAPPPVVADDRRNAQITPVLDTVFTDHELGLLEEDLSLDLVPALRPRE